MRFILRSLQDNALRRHARGGAKLVDEFACDDYVVHATHGRDYPMFANAWVS